MKRLRTLAALLLLVVGLAGCGDAGHNEIAPGRLIDQELQYLQALTEDTLVFALGEGEYQAAIYCYTQGSWSNAGTLGYFGGGGNLLFATQMQPASERRQPDTWVCFADGITLSGYMLWEDEADANVKVNSYLAASMQMEPGVEYVVAAYGFTDEEEVGIFDIDVGGAFDVDTAGMDGYTHAWVLTLTAA